MKPTLFAMALLAFSTLIAGQNKWTGRVKVTVNGDDQATFLIRSYLNTELRGLGDVITTDSQPDYRLSLIVLRTPGGYAISVLTDQYFNTKLYCAAISPPSVKSTFTDVPATDVQIVNIVGEHWLETCPTSALQQTIKTIVAKFDADTLQPSRNISQSIRDLFDAQQKKEQSR